jgi:catalase (peroxidase I)
MGFRTFGFAGGREDDWQAEMVNRGPVSEFLADERYKDDQRVGQAARRRSTFRPMCHTTGIQLQVLSARRTHKEVQP